ncbi:MAG: winged helix-turn-helix domain-containing protein [Armatimonadota bacterium]
MMLEYILGNATKEKILFFLYTYKEGYAKGIADLFEIPVNAVQQQLKRLEEGAVVVSQLKGKTRVYQFNPRFPFLKELEALLEKAMIFLPSKEIDRYYRKRTRPRRAGKPL